MANPLINSGDAVLVAYHLWNSDAGAWEPEF